MAAQRMVHIQVLLQHMYKRKRQPGKVTASPGTADDYIRVCPYLLKLLLCFKTYNRLMKNNMIQNAAKRVACFT